MSGGERKGDREAMDRVVQRMIRDGVPPEKAEKDARESMRRTDKSLERQGKR